MLSLSCVFSAYPPTLSTVFTLHSPVTTLQNIDTANAENDLLGYILHHQCVAFNPLVFISKWKYINMRLRHLFKNTVAINVAFSHSTIWKC